MFQSSSHGYNVAITKTFSHSHPYSGSYSLISDLHSLSPARYRTTALISTPFTKINTSLAKAKRSNFIPWITFAYIHEIPIATTIPVTDEFKTITEIYVTQRLSVYFRNKYRKHSFNNVRT